MSHHRIEARALGYTYPGGGAALSDVSFVITHGESVGLIGANGAGKSTLLHLLVGLLSPTVGAVYVGDVQATQKTLPLIRSHLGLAFQNPDDQLFMTTVYDDVAFGPRNAGLSDDEVDRRVHAALKTMGVPHLADRAPHRCSGGEKRAAAMASVLSMEPDALLLDEPTNGLDPRARRRVMERLSAFSHTKIIASHDIAMIAELCGRVILLQDGRIVADEATNRILSDDRLMDEAGLKL